MLGAGALTSLAAIRAGAGLVTWGVPKSLTAAAQKKASNCVMTWPLHETSSQSLSSSAYAQIKKSFLKYSVIALGPGLSQDTNTQKLILRIIETSPLPIVLDADALNALIGKLKYLTRCKTIKVLTPHPGEMSRLTKQNIKHIESNRSKVAQAFANKFNCACLLKGPETVVAAPGKRPYTNKSGNSGMATAGSGDVLTGIISAFLAQGLSGFDAAKYGALLHGTAGDLAAGSKTRTSMIADDIIDNIPKAFKLLIK